MVAELTPALLDADDTTLDQVKKAMIKDLKAIAKLPASSKPKVYFYVAAKVHLKNIKLKPVNLLVVVKDDAQRKLWDARLKTHAPRITTGLCKVELVKDVPEVAIGALKGGGDRKAALLTARVALKEAGASKVKVVDERDMSKADTRAAAGTAPDGKAALAQAATKTQQVLSAFGLNPKAASEASKQLGIATDVVNLVVSQNEAKLKAAIAKALKDAGLAAAS